LITAQAKIYPIIGAIIAGIIRLMRMPRIPACVIINELPADKINDEKIATAVVARVVFKIPNLLIHLRIIHLLRFLEAVLMRDCGFSAYLDMQKVCYPRIRPKVLS
jgi:hypothetical protein